MHAWKKPALNIFSVGEYPPFPGGAAISGATICRELARIGHKITVFTQEYGGKLAPKIPGVKFVLVKTKRVLDTDRATIQLAGRRRQGEGLGGEIAKLPFIRAIEREMKFQRPDVMIVNYGVPYANFVMPLAKRTGIPVITVLRGSDVHVLPLPGYRRTKKAILEAYGKSDAIVTVSDYLRKLLAGLGEKRAVTFRNAIDAKQFIPLEKKEIESGRKRIGIPADATVFAHVSTLKPVKQPLKIILAAEIALKKNPGLYFLVVGNGELAPEMKKKVGEKGLGKRIKFMGESTLEKVRTYLGLSDALVMASEREGLPRAVLEAIALGKPVISTRAGGIPEVVKHNSTGFLYEYGDINQLARYMLLMDNPLVKKRLSRATAELSKTMSLERTVAKYDALIRRVSRNRNMVTQTPGRQVSRDKITGKRTSRKPF